jgi:outer membrane lipoprotein-sorting protein
MNELIRQPDSSPPDVRGLVDQYNRRDLGTPAWRRVVLKLVNNQQVSRTFTVVNLWLDMDRQVRTLFLLEDPSGLRGTNYLLMEDRGGLQDSDMKIFLQLPAGQRLPLEINSGSFNEGLLGSDFNYNDMRMLMPAAGYEYRMVGQSTLLDTPAWVIEATPSSKATLKKHARSSALYYLAQDFPLVLGVDVFDGTKTGEQGWAKRMRVQSFEKIEGIWTATRITMTAPGGRASILELKDIHYRVKHRQEEVFVPERLPDLTERVRRGWSPENDIGR